MADHRPAVAAQRRERMRARLIEAALPVVARKGIAETQIEDIIAAAEVSRGTFYNHFPTVAELLRAAYQQLGNELATRVEADIRAEPDPARRMAQGLLNFLATARAYPLVGRFIVGLGVTGLGEGNLVHALLPPHLEAGVRAGQFLPMPLDLAVDMIAASMMVALQRDSRGETVNPTDVIAALLRMIGVSVAQVAQLATLEPVVLQMGPETLVARSNALLQDG
ncbi:TetR family transcriptional regulator [Gemmobacter lanyuensis]|uniref:TetR family transcriptional regulator n=1 Tax=Gemmobacter lanyuensis TaxID=1054497 RepID=A0A918MM64_9RHOB|nr:TetR/AcrR family transcriptional regulator [Gemmobacter lanyuensis]GGW35575.1 TetR family transcriptional regulator [Gemmobacter lanyuensis]